MTDLGDYFQTMKMLRAWHEATLQMWGLVPRTQYLEVLEENARLKRRIAELEGCSPEAAHAAAEVQNAFSQMLDAQREWMQAWVSKSDKPDGGE